MLCAFGSRGLLSALVDLPFAISTTVTGILLVPLLGPRSLLGSRLEAEGAREARDRARPAIRHRSRLVAGATLPVVREPAPAAEEAARIGTGRERP